MIDYTIDDGDDDGMVNEGWKTRTVKINGREFKVKATDPYGLWTIAVTKGTLPKDLDGSFTTAELAITQIERWVHAYVPPNPDNPHVEEGKTRKKVLKPKLFDKEV